MHIKGLHRVPQRDRDDFRADHSCGGQLKFDCGRGTGGISNYLCRFYVLAQSYEFFWLDFPGFFPLKYKSNLLIITLIIYMFTGRVLVMYIVQFHPN